MDKRIWIICLLALALLAGCSENSTTRRTSGPPSKKATKMLAHTPVVCFEKIRAAVLKNNSADAFELFTPLLKQEQGNSDGFRTELSMNYTEYVKRWKTAKIEPGSLHYDRDVIAWCRVRWGDGSASGLYFHNTRAGWKLAISMHAVEKE